MAPSSDIPIRRARVFQPLLQPARYRAAWGGRGSGKSHFFAELLIEGCLLQPSTSALCVREVQKSLAQSSKRLLETKIRHLGVGGSFRPLHERLETPGGGSIVFVGMQDATAESVKSYEGFGIAWIDRQTVCRSFPRGRIQHCTAPGKSRRRCCFHADRSCQAPVAEVLV